MNPARRRDQERDDPVLQALAADFAELRRAQPGDPLLLRRAVRAAARRARPARLPWRFAVAASLLLGAGAAAWHLSRPEGTEPAPRKHPPPALPPAGAAPAGAQGAEAPLREPPPEPTGRDVRQTGSEANPGRDEAGAPKRAADGPPGPTADRRADLAPGPDAAALFEAARRAEHAGQRARARALYGRLLRLHPESREAPVATVALGWLELEHGGGPRRALRRFRDYLRRWPRGPLAQEAREGEARALRRLGRAEEAREAWRRLAAEHPGALLPPEAREALRESASR